MVIKKFTFLIKWLAAMVLCAVRFFVLTLVVFSAVAISLIDSIIFYTIGFWKYFFSVKGKRILFPRLKKSHIWWVSRLMSRGFYKQRPYDSKSAISPNIDYYDVVTLRRLISDWFFLYAYVLFSSGYYRVLGNYFGFEHDYFYSILEKARSTRTHGFDNLYSSMFSGRVRTRVGVIPLFFLFLAKQREIDDFIRTNFLVVDGFVFDFFPADCSPQLAAYLDLFNTTAEYHIHIQNYARYLSKDATLRHWDIDILRNRRLISLRVLRYLIFYESFRTYQQGGLQSIRRYRAFCRMVDKVEKTRLEDAGYKKIKWSPYSNLKWFSRYLENDTRGVRGRLWRFFFRKKKSPEEASKSAATKVKDIENKEPKAKVKKTRFERFVARVLRRRRRRTSTFYRVRFVFRRLGFIKALLGRRRYNKIFVSGDPIERSGRLIRSYRRPNLFYFFVNLFLLLFCFLFELISTKRDNFYFRVVELIPIFKFLVSRVLGIFVFFIFSAFQFIRFVFYNSFFLSSILLNCVVVAWNEPRLFRLIFRIAFVRRDFCKLRALIYKFAPSSRRSNVYSFAFSSFRLSARLCALSALEFISAFFTFLRDISFTICLFFFAKFVTYPVSIVRRIFAVRAGFSPFFWFLSFVLLFVAVIYICFSYFSLFSFSNYRFLIAEAYSDFYTRKGLIPKILHDLMSDMRSVSLDNKQRVEVGDRVSKGGAYAFVIRFCARLYLFFNRISALKPRPWRFRLVPTSEHKKSSPRPFYSYIFRREFSYSWKTDPYNRMGTTRFSFPYGGVFGREGGKLKKDSRRLLVYERLVRRKAKFLSRDWYRYNDDKSLPFLAYFIKPRYKYKFVIFRRRRLKRKPGVRYRIRHPAFRRIHGRVVRRRFVGIPRLFQRYVGRHLSRWFFKYLGYRNLVIKPALSRFLNYLVTLAKAVFSFKVFAWYTLFVIMVAVGGWSIKQIILNPALKDMLVRYRRAVACFIVLNLLAIVLFNIWRYKILGRAEFYAEWGDIVMTSYGIIGYVGILVLTFLGLQHAYDAFLSGKSLILAVVGDSEILILLGLVVLLLFIFFIYIRSLYLNFVGRNLTARELVFLTEFERAALLESRTQSVESLGFAQNLFDRIYTLVCLCAGVFVLSFLLFYRCFFYLLFTLRTLLVMVYEACFLGQLPDCRQFKYMLLRPVYFLMYWLRICVINILLEAYWFWVSVRCIVRYIGANILSLCGRLIGNFNCLVRRIVGFLLFGLFKLSFIIFLLPILSLFSFSILVFSFIFAFLGLVVVLLGVWQKNRLTRVLTIVLLFAIFSILSLYFFRF